MRAAVVTNGGWNHAACKSDHVAGVKDFLANFKFTTSSVGMISFLAIKIPLV